jgi:hypothetical protein
MCISRFETETREAFLDLYTKIDAGILKADDATSADDAVAKVNEVDAPF